MMCKKHKITKPEIDGEIEKTVICFAPRRISQYNGCKGGKKQQQARIRLLHDNMA